MDKNDIKLQKIMINIWASLGVALFIFLLFMKNNVDTGKFIASMIVSLCIIISAAISRVFLKSEEKDLEFENRFDDLYKRIKELHELSDKNNTEYKIKKVIFNKPATIIFWEDGTKTIVTCQKGDKYDKEKGLVMAIVKHFYGNKSKYNDIIKKFIDKD